ncbi:uncharacterized protein N7459_005859 [Penicillium hispanicum]|uniref:uncharacterized protein n=1 Tax=Penicillium hispanicum TaxID=1080232 RepID=UPI0025421BB8|nr:uncharacterized protein N7459_005859 [Penicillium hispanicum]KAJ5579874.1 hypothetical protein N7459_005859 [Penicillium hispanicum]
MPNLFKAMANLVKKFKRKHRVSSELHSRWGDTSISHPNDGSWNQWNQPSGFVANASNGERQNSQSEETRRYISMGQVPPHSPGMLSDYGSHYTYSPEPMHAESTFPKGYFDENIRHRPERSHRPPVRGLGINAARHDMTDENEGGTCDESCDEDDEGRDTLGDPGGGPIYRGYATGDMPRSSPRDFSDSYNDHSARSPPLSVTSRMRHFSVQSSMTEQSSSVAGTASSRRTSYTAASSVSAPSLPPDTPRYAYTTTHAAHAEKRPPVPRPRYREPEPAARNELVPSYDELYG